MGCILKCNVLPSCPVHKVHIVHENQIPVWIEGAVAGLPCHLEKQGPARWSLVMVRSGSCTKILSPERVFMVRHAEDQVLGGPFRTSQDDGALWRQSTSPGTNDPEIGKFHTRNSAAEAQYVVFRSQTDTASPLIATL